MAQRSYKTTEDERKKKAARMRAVNADKLLRQQNSVRIDEEKKRGPRGTRRFYLADIDEMGLWILKRLKERYTFLDDKTSLGWLRSCMDRNDFLFMRTDHTVGLAVVGHIPLMAVPYVQEVFVFIRDPDDPNQLREGQEIYRHFRQWAASMNAKELRLDIFSDLPMSYIKNLLGEIMVIEIAVKRFGD